MSEPLLPQTQTQNRGTRLSLPMEIHIEDLSKSFGTRGDNIAVMHFPVHLIPELWRYAYFSGPIRTVKPGYVPVSYRI